MLPSLPFINFFLQYDVVIVVIVVVIVVVIIIVVVDGDDDHDDDDDDDNDDDDGDEYNEDGIVSLKKNRGQGWAHNIVVCIDVSTDWGWQCCHPCTFLIFFLQYDNVVVVVVVVLVDVVVVRSLMAM